MLELIATILALLWLLRLVSYYIIDGFVHLLPVLAIIPIFLRRIPGRPVAWPRLCMPRQKTRMNGMRRRVGPARRCGLFERFAHGSARAVGHPVALGLAIVLVLGWALTGPLFGFGDTRQLVINTATTVVTLLMLFLIQSTQNRDSEAMQLKLDELIRATKEAHNALLDIEGLSEAELDRIKSRYEELA